MLILLIIITLVRMKNHGGGEHCIASIFSGSCNRLKPSDIFLLVIACHWHCNWIEFSLAVLTDHKIKALIGRGLLSKGCARHPFMRLSLHDITTVLLLISYGIAVAPSS